MKENFLLGMRHGIPICLGYLSVSFGFGILAVQCGLSVGGATAVSALNLTSAGQAAGVRILAYGGSLLEMAATQLIINLRYSFMAISLSQRLDASFSTGKRMIAAFGITDEIFAVAWAQPGAIGPWYLYGLIFVSFLGWVGGTILGAAAGQFLPKTILNAMGILLYGMFLAIFIPPAKKEKSVCLAVVAAAGVSMIFFYLLPQVTSGFAIIISAVLAAALAAWLFPKKEEAL